MPLAQEARKPMFFLKPADGALGAHTYAVTEAYKDFKKVATKIAAKDDSRIDMEDHPRLIEVAFPLKQASLDSVHEKNVRHGHISTLHLWPARRPLAACRAALIATLLPDPGTPEKRKELLEKIGGKVVTEVQKKKVGGKAVEVIKEGTEGGMLHWGNEHSPDMDWFREEIKKAYGGRAPRVLDPFAGGGAIPLEAMRSAAKRPRSTSTPSPGLSSNALWNIPRS